MVPPRKSAIEPQPIGILGIGTDIERIERFLPDRRSPRLLARIFTPDEIAYCEGQARPERHYAARFAAKEATVKALSRLLPRLTIPAVEVTRDPETGMPGLRLLPDALAIVGAQVLMHVSLSHSGEYATAFVVAERVPQPDHGA